MKVLEFETGKGKFCLIDMPDEIRINGWNGYIFLSKDLQISQTKFSSGYYLKNITEGQASRIVDEGDCEPSSDKYVPGFRDYEIDDIEVYVEYYTAIESLYSLLESKGVYLFYNPYKDVGLIPSYEQKLYRDAKQKTFYNPFIFKL